MDPPPIAAVPGQSSGAHSIDGWNGWYRIGPVLYLATAKRRKEARVGVACVRVRVRA